MKQKIFKVHIYGDFTEIENFTANDLQQIIFDGTVFMVDVYEME